ncbi:MAG: peroxiredoxin [Hyphomicrobiales bacterium]|nr:MAG: peroxiredoxin [Hyphomicrobiales bacterium]
MTIKVGDHLPEATFNIMGLDGPTTLSSADLFAGKTVVLFAIPGAFTPTCHRNHLPGFLENFDTILSKGVDTVACVSVNDAFVMGAWGENTGANGKILMLADGSAAFTKAIGMDVDLSERGFGVRSQRYSMLVEDGVVKSLNVEPAAGQAVVSGAAALLEQLG